MVGMEASLLSATVTGALKILGNKLAPLVIKEYSSIVGVKKDLQELKDQVQDINVNLERAGDRDPKDAPWLKKLQEVVYDIDDIVDEFQLKAEKHEIDGDGGFVSKCLLTKKAESLVLQCRAAKNIKKIKKRFAKIVKQRNVMKAIFDNDPVIHINKTAKNMQTLPVEEGTVLGRDQEMHQIISRLMENNDKNEIKIVSIVGLGGSGKTTLAKQVFNDGEIIENHFEVRLWVYVSQEFDIETIVKKLYEAFADKDQGQPSLPYMSKRVQEGLTKKKFLIVMDDVWTESQIEWDKIMGYLKKGAPGSGVLLTTRSAAVAEVVRSTYQFCLQPLSPNDSWLLFQQSLGMQLKHLESEFVEVGKEIVNKCGGVPLAIKVIAGVLHGKELIGEWHAMRDSNLLDVEGKEAGVSVSRCLRLSYLHLPSHMKHCFTMCSVFPKGYMIDKEKLIDLWIAHDMITPQAGVDFLDIGDRYFNSLVQMSFLQDVGEHFYVRRIVCTMHDLVHDLALSILDDKFSPVVPKDATSSANSCRYFSLIERPENMAPKNIFRKARAIYMSWFGDYKNVMSLKHAKHLRSIMVGHLDEEGANIISQVKYLKYLSVSSLRSCKTLPECISDVWSLQALYVTYNKSLVEIPESIGKLRKLRTLNLSGCLQLKHLPESIGDCEIISTIDLCHCEGLIVLPNSIGKLQKLRRLNLSSCNELKCLPDTIGDCKMISSIDLRSCGKLTVLPDSIGKLQKLGTLNLSECTKLKCLPDTIGDCKMISSIDLRSCGKLTVLPDSIGKLQKLGTLNLSGCTKLKCLPDCIGKNEKLGVLRLSYTNIERLPSSVTKLRNLQCLDLHHCLELVDLPEGIGNLEKLQLLNLLGCKKLEGMPIGIGQLSGLQKFGLFVVGKGEKFAAISELANVSKIGQEVLKIRGISHVIEPEDAHMACLKQKTHLQHLVLEWMFTDEMEEVNTDEMVEVNTGLQQDVLDGLEPPPGIKLLEIHGYSGRQFGRWMQNQVGSGVQGPSPFPLLRVMRLCGFPNLKHLHGLVELPCLEKLQLKDMPSLESISGGPFPSLLKLMMCRLPCLGEVWMVPKRTSPDEEGGCYCSFTRQLGQFWVGNCLTMLGVYYCPKLEVKPHLPPSLQYLQMPGNEQLLQSPGQCKGSSSPPNFNRLKMLKLWDVTRLESRHRWELLQHMTALDSLEIRDFSGVETKVLEGLWSLTSFRSLQVSSWSNVRMLPESIGELRSLQDLMIQSCPSLPSLPQTMGLLTSLQLLVIKSCKALRQLPDCLGGLCSLQKLEIKNLPELTCLPESICHLKTSLQELKIDHCPGIISLPQGIEGLASLEKLSIWYCKGLTSLPQGIEGLASLQNLSISNCTGLTSLPQGIKGLVSLEELHIVSCPGIQSLPECIKGLTALKTLGIGNCPDLQRRCKRQKGEDWHLISHIPDISVWTVTVHSEVAG